MTETLTLYNIGPALAQRVKVWIDGEPLSASSLASKEKDLEVGNITVGGSREIGITRGNPTHHEMAVRIEWTGARPSPTASSAAIA